MPSAPSAPSAPASSSAAEEVEEVAVEDYGDTGGHFRVAWTEKVNCL